jgi:hypothetical protein
MNPSEPDKWQTAYTENRGFDDSLKRTGALLIPVLITLIIPLFYTILYIFKVLTTTPANKMSSALQLISNISPGFALALLALSGSFMTLSLIKKDAGTFLQTFYNLPDSIKVGELTGLRIFGRMPLPPPLSRLIKFPLLKVKNGKIEPLENWQAIIGGPGKLQIEPGNAVYLECGNKFSRVLGQGFAFMDLHEQIKAVVNVGPQSRVFEVSAWTQDGIHIKLTAKGEYFLGSPERNSKNENMLIPFNAEAVQKAVEAALKSGKEGHEWIEGAIGKTKGILSGYIANKGLDEIFIHGARLFTKANMDALLKEINGKLQDSGAYLSYFQITDVTMHDDITDQRLETWESTHKKQQILVAGENKARQILESKKTHAEIQRNLIHTLANGLERIDAASDTEQMLQKVYALLDREVTNSWWNYSSSREDYESSKENDNSDAQQPAEAQ